MNENEAEEVARLKTALHAAHTQYGVLNRAYAELNELYVFDHKQVLHLSAKVGEMEDARKRYWYFIDRMGRQVAMITWGRGEPGPGRLRTTMEFNGKTWEWRSCHDNATTDENHHYYHEVVGEQDE